MISNPSLNWEKLQGVFYRSRQLVQLEWPHTYDVHYAISIAFIAVETGDSIQIYDYLGKLHCELNIENFDGIVDFSFDETDPTRLFIACSNSLKLVESWKPLKITTIRLDPEIQDTIWSFKNGVIILRESKDVLRYIPGSRTLQLVARNNNQYQLLTKNHWHCNKDLAVLLDVDHIFVIDLHTNTLGQLRADSQWQRVIISSSGFICLYNAKYNKLQVFKDPNRILLEQTIDETPTDIKWCGDDSIACSFEDEIKLYSPEGDYVTFWYPDDIVALRTECDGLKVFTEANCYLISKVHEATSNVFRIGSTEPGAMLLDSWYMLPSHAPRAIEYLDSFNLKSGVMECISAARDELHSEFQKNLLNAASFGKSFLPYKEFDSEIFVRACNEIKLLNTLRSLGIFVTRDEFEDTTFESIVHILLASNKYGEALNVCKLFDKTEFLPIIMASWAETKIKLSPDKEDAELFKDIENHMNDVDVKVKVPMSKISHTAFLEGRFNLARSLALLESSPEQKILALLDLDEDSLALKESLKTESPEFILSLLLKLKEKLTNAQLAKLLLMDLPRNNLYLYSQRKDYAFLFDFYRQSDNLTGLAHCIIGEAEQKGHSVKPFLPQVKDLYKHVTGDPILKQDVEFLERNEKLLAYQESLGSVLGVDVSGYTLNKTLELLIEANQQSHVSELVKKYKISDKNYYHATCRALVKTKRFHDLYTFATSKKSPIGYQPFFNYILRAGYKEEAAKYVPIISNVNYETKKKMLLECQAYTDFIELASKEKDIRGLRELYKIIPEAEISQWKHTIDEALSKL